MANQTNLHTFWRKGSPARTRHRDLLAASACRGCQRPIMRRVQGAAKFIWPLLLRSNDHELHPPILRPTVGRRVVGDWAGCPVAC